MTPLWPERPLRNACLIVGSETIQRLKRDQHTEASCDRCLQQGTRADLSCVHALVHERSLAGASLLSGIYRNRRLHSRRNCFQLWAFALRGKSKICCEFDFRDAVQFCCRFCRCIKLWPLNTAIETCNLIDSRCEIFFRVSVSRYTNVVGNIKVISWNLFRYISLLLFVALFFPWFLFFFSSLFFQQLGA
jgi:hypothetical protein